MLFVVYISSTSEFKDIRQNIIAEIKKRGKLYQVNSMEDYTAEDVPAVTRCRNDVNDCHIYVCIWGSQYGTVVNDGKGMSFTHHEFDEATTKKKPRLIFLKTFPPGKEVPDSDANLTALKNEISNEKQLLTQKFDEDENLPERILAAMDNYVASLQAKKEIQIDPAVYNKIYLCDRDDSSQECRVLIDEAGNTVQFFMLKGHENDLPRDFVTRQEMEHEGRKLSWKNIIIKPFISDRVTSYEKAEVVIKAEIVVKLKADKIKLWNDVTPTALAQYMLENNINYLSFIWIIDRALWKNERLNDYIVQFYQKFSSGNPSLNADMKILFFGFLTYTRASEISEEQFYNLINNICWANNFRLNKLNKQHIIDWMGEYDIEYVSANCENLIGLYLSDIAKSDMYYSEVKDGLKKIIDHYNNK
jgi:hypothetical protein